MTTPSKIRLTIQDGGRHRHATGYGKNARSFILGLSALPDFEVSLVPTTTDWAIEEWYREPLSRIAPNPDLKAADIILQLGTPTSCRKMPRPSAMFTNIDVSDMTDAEQEVLSNADMLLAPNKGNFDIFSKRFVNVRLCQQGISEHFFRPQKRFRAEGDPKFSLIFVGSFSYRKGVDLLLRAFAEEFDEKEARLTLHLPGEMGDRANSFIMRAIREVGRPIDVVTSTKSMSEAWMSRMYNRHDAFVTMTRGEGWGLPVVEAMLCGLPVIAPFSTGMRDYLNEDVAAIVPATDVPLASITDGFAANFIKAHAGEDIALAEPDVAAARAQMRRLADDAALRDKMGTAGRAHILKNFSEKNFVNAVADALRDLYRSTAETRPEIGARPAVVESPGLKPAMEPSVKTPEPPATAAAEPAPKPAAPVTPPVVPAGERLEIGAGSNPMPGYVHHDIRPLPDIEVICDARSFPAEHKGRYAEVYGANIIEHFNRFEVKKVLAEWVSLLRPGGIIKLITPDSREIARQLVENKISMEWYSYLVYGGQDYEFNRHGFAFDAESLAAMLETHGLEVVRKKPGLTWEQRKRDIYCPMIEVWGRRPHA